MPQGAGLKLRDKLTPGALCVVYVEFGPEVKNAECWYGRGHIFSFVEKTLSLVLPADLGIIKKGSGFVIAFDRIWRGRAGKGGERRGEVGQSGARWNDHSQREDEDKWTDKDVLRTSVKTYSRGYTASSSPLSVGAV